mmetsp:Transcript_1899/g.4299  ORF Transcript_1899/g.4299 Transcript_1899/m.4299 type:complete len:282 (+) Transcript_1899:1218-2063(+)
MKSWPGIWLRSTIISGRSSLSCGGVDVLAYRRPDDLGATVWTADRAGGAMEGTVGGGMAKASSLYVGDSMPWPGLSWGGSDSSGLGTGVLGWWPGFVTRTVGPTGGAAESPATDRSSLSVTGRSCNAERTSSDELVATDLPSIKRILSPACNLAAWPGLPGTIFKTIGTSPRKKPSSIPRVPGTSNTTSQTTNPGRTTKDPCFDTEPSTANAGRMRESAAGSHIPGLQLNSTLSPDVCKTCACVQRPRLADWYCTSCPGRYDGAGFETTAASRCFTVVEAS